RDGGITEIAGGVVPAEAVDRLAEPARLSGGGREGGHGRDRYDGRHDEFSHGAFSTIVPGGRLPGGLVLSYQMNARLLPPLRRPGRGAGFRDPTPYRSHEEEMTPQNGRGCYPGPAGAV